MQSVVRHIGSLLVSILDVQRLLRPIWVIGLMCFEMLWYSTHFPMAVYLLDELCKTFHLVHSHNIIALSLHISQFSLWFILSLHDMFASSYSLWSFMRHTAPSWYTWGSWLYTHYRRYFLPSKENQFIWLVLHTSHTYVCSTCVCICEWQALSSSPRYREIDVKLLETFFQHVHVQVVWFLQSWYCILIVCYLT